MGQIKRIPWSVGLRSLNFRLTLMVAVISTASLAAGAALLVRSVETTVLRSIESQDRHELRIAPSQHNDAVGVAQAPVHSGGPRDESLLGPTGFPVLAGEPAALRAVAISPLDDFRQSSEVLKRILSWGVPALSIVLTLSAWALIRRTLKPVLTLTQHAARIAADDIPGRLEVPATSDEIEELGRTLNDMLDRLAHGVRLQREFVSDASHELRSPIASARAQIEVALAYPLAAPWPVLPGVLAEIVRLESLTADLLALARLDEQQPAVEEEVDLDDVVFEEARRRRSLPVDTRHVSPAKVGGVRKDLTHLLRNLVDNAAAHAKSQVFVSVHREGAISVLRVDDDGPGIPEVDRDRVFERFTRLSTSRSPDGGTGLGLALVQRIARHHGGTTRVTQSPQGGARVEVRFPARPLG